MIDLRGIQMIEHVGGGAEQNALFAWQARQPMILGQQSLAHTRIANDNDAGALVQKLEVQQTDHASLDLPAAFMMFEVEAINRVAGLRRERGNRRSMAL
jgi:hypothetical protein